VPGGRHRRRAAGQLAYHGPLEALSRAPALDAAFNGTACLWFVRPREAGIHRPCAALHSLVTPAKAGVQVPCAAWVPAFAGTTLPFLVSLRKPGSGHHDRSLGSTLLGDDVAIAGRPCLDWFYLPRVTACAPCAIARAGLDTGEQESWTAVEAS